MNIYRSGVDLAVDSGEIVSRAGDGSLTVDRLQQIHWAGLGVTADNVATLSTYKHMGPCMWICAELEGRIFEDGDLCLCRYPQR